jgi:capsular exopolysaccharide synthesis family protein
MDIQHYCSVLKRRWFPASLVFISISASAIGLLILQKNIYQAEGKIRFTRGDRATSLTGVGKEGEFDPLVETNNPMTTEIEVIRSVPIIQSTIDRLKLKDEQGNVLTRRQFLRDLNLNTTRGADVLQVAYKDENSDRAKSVVNTLMTLYLENHLRENRAEAVAARQFIERQLPEAEASVRVADANLRRFKEANQVAALQQQEQATVAALEDLRRRVAEAKTELANADAQSTAFNQQLGMNPQEGMTMAALSQSHGVQEVLKQLQAVESQLAVERVRFQDASPIVKNLKERKANLEGLLQARITQSVGDQTLPAQTNLQIGELRSALVGDFVRSEVRRQGLAEQVTALANAELAYQQRIAVLPRLEQEQRELTRRLEAAQSTYSLLLQRLHETRVAEHQNVGNARIIQKAALLEKPIAPRPVLYIGTGGILALLLAIATALSLESKDKSIKTVKAARDIFGLTLLGMIPSYRNLARNTHSSWEVAPSASDVIVKHAPNSPISEAYRMLQANLKFLSSDRLIKTIVVTSSVPNEGKSVVSANLALARAQLGHKVLLIDADMRRPCQHQIWDLLNDTGLSNTIVEQFDPRTVIKNVAPNLDVLTAGVIPPNPVVLLDSQRMAALIDQFSNSYDLVVIDTPSLNTVADVPILGRMADGVLIVTRPGVVDEASATFAKERLEQSDQTVLGQVINGVIHDNEPYSYYYFTEDAIVEGTVPKKKKSLRGA